MASVSLGCLTNHCLVWSLTYVSVIPDLTTEQNVSLLERWEGSWSYLSNLVWVRVSANGQVRPSSFPPQGH
jgi:hypothetical protein